VDRLVLAACLLSIVGCGPARGRPADPAGDTADRAGSGGGSAQPSCPATYAAVPLGTYCDAPGATCGFAEGTCTCAARSYCGGAAPPPELLAELARPAWQCHPFRTDGCPEAQPAGACEHDGQTCSYGDCCFVAVTCQAGAWVVTGGGCPP
jgi:hypothetical protein